MDKARKLTDKELAKLEREISELYFVSQAEISEKWNKYMQSHKKKLDRLYDKLQEAKKSGDKDAIRDAEAEYERAVKNVTLNDKRYKAMINETTAKIANVNQIALDYVNGDMPKIYTLNYNEFDNQDIDGYSFTLVNERAVENLIKSNKIELPPKKVNIPKDQAWNAKNINSQLLQGIIQGESIAKIAKRLQNVTDMNKKSALRNARTMVTGAENKGRQDSFKKAQDDGVIMEREWIAAHDDRTRAWHLDLHGVRVGVDEPWENDYGEIMFPGDPTADPANVYNCRCSIRAHVKGFKWSKERLDEVKDDKRVKHEVVNGKDISATWKRRPDQFDFEIEDVINAQGFDGLPRVVDAEEFDRYVQESNFIAQRTYSAPNQETLDAYRDQLYNGKWYVDCSTGGAQYGQGMYCAANYEGKLTDGIKAEMHHYQEVGESRFSKSTMPVSYTETLTLDPSAKIIKYNDLWEMRQSIEEETKVKYVDSALNDVLKSKNLDNNVDAKTFIGFQTQTGNVSWDDATKAHDNLQKAGLVGEVNALVPEAHKAKMAALDKGLEEWNRDQYKYNDLGVLATSKGYDAINAEGHGESSSYTVILNRTKCIFRKGG